MSVYLDDYVDWILHAEDIEDLERIKDNADREYGYHRDSYRIDSAYNVRLSQLEEQSDEEALEDKIRNIVLSILQEHGLIK